MSFFPPADESEDHYSVGGQTIVFERFEPHGTGKFPAVIVLHGSDGPYLYRDGYHELARGLVSQGYAAYLLHYLDRTGAVPPVELSTIPASFAAWMEAVDAGIDHVAGLPKVDNTRMGIVGISLGAYLALSIAPRNRRIRAVVEFFGGLSEPYHPPTGAMPPVLILHGAGDQTVPVSEAHSLAALLRRLEVDHEIKIYERQGHGFRGPALWDSARRMVAFLHKHLGR